MDFFRASPPDDAVDEDAPESLKGLVPGEIGARDPDARPPSNPLHYIIRALSSKLARMGCSLLICLTC